MRMSDWSSDVCSSDLHGPGSSVGPGPCLGGDAFKRCHFVGGRDRRPGGRRTGAPAGPCFGSDQIVAVGFPVPEPRRIPRSMAVAWRVMLPQEIHGTGGTIGRAHV